MTSGEREKSVVKERRWLGREAEIVFGRRAIQRHAHAGSAMTTIASLAAGTTRGRSRPRHSPRGALRAQRVPRAAPTFAIFASGFGARSRSPRRAPVGRRRRRSRLRGGHETRAGERGRGHLLLLERADLEAKFALLTDAQRRAGTDRVPGVARHPRRRRRRAARLLRRLRLLRRRLLRTTRRVTGRLPVRTGRSGVGMRGTNRATIPAKKPAASTAALCLTPRSTRFARRRIAWRCAGASARRSRNRPKV